MESGELLRTLFEYDHWANGETLASLEVLAGAREKPLKYFSHVIAAQQIWRARFADLNPSSAQAWPTLSIEECRQSIEELHGEWIALLSGLTDEKLASDLLYRNTKGAEFRTPIRDLLVHLVMHSVYHRGQVAAAVREAGGQPAASDYVVYVRKANR